MSSSKNNRAYPKKMCKKASVNYDESEKENRSHEYGINRSASRHGLTYTKYKKFISMMKIICIKQHPTDTS